MHCDQSECILASEVLRNFYQGHNGYFRTWLLGTKRGGKMPLAHRLVYEECFGPIPEGMYVCHHCDNPGCVSPEHLFLGSAKDNHDDSARKNRHSHGSGHGMSKLTAQDVRKLRILRNQGSGLAELSAMFGITEANVSYIARRKTWKHVR